MSQLWTPRPVQVALVGGMKPKTGERDTTVALTASYGGQVVIVSTQTAAVITVIAVLAAGVSITGAIVLGATETQAAVMKAISRKIAVGAAAQGGEAIPQIIVMPADFHLAPAGAVTVLAADAEVVPTVLDDGHALHTDTVMTVRTAMIEIEDRCRSVVVMMSGELRILFVKILSC